VWLVHLSEQLSIVIVADNLFSYSELAKAKKNR
jgi:hypothetical protein